MSETPPTAPSGREINTETNPTRKAVLAAMARMLAGTRPSPDPGCSARPGWPAKPALIATTSPKAPAATSATASPPSPSTAPTTAREADQQAHIDGLTTQLNQLTESHTALRQDRDNWQAATHTLLRAIQVQRLEHTAMQSDIRVLHNQLAAARHRGTSGLYPVPSARSEPNSPS